MPSASYCLARFCLASVLLIVSGCASTTLTVTPSPQQPVCQRGDERINALVLWGTSWRSDQKDIPEREKAAAQGIDHFFAATKCFAAVTIRKEPSASGLLDDAARDGLARPFDKSVMLVVRELGPVLTIGSSFALVEGGTEVVLDLSVTSADGIASPRRFSVHWANGGGGVIKGVASLPADMAAALAAALQPEGK